MHRHSRLGLAVLAALGAGLAVAMPAWAQDPGVGVEETRPKETFRASPYLPLTDPAYPILDYWISAGRITSLSPFVKPYRRIEVARALLELDPGALSTGEEAWLSRLREALSAEFSWLEDAQASNTSVSFELGAGAGFYSQTHRDPLRPEFEGEFSDGQILEDVRVEADGQAGPVAGALRTWREGMYRHDAQYPGGRVTERRDGVLFDDLSTRIEEGYLELQSKYARLSFGRMYREWGAPGLPGFQRSDYAYSQEEISYRVGTDRVFLIGMFASYPDFGADTAHYVAMHRLEIRPIDNLVIGLAESTAHGGPGENVDFRIVNPISIWQIAGKEEDTPYNKVGVFDAWWRAADWITVYGSVLADATNREGSCCQMGGSFGLELPRLLPGWVLRANGSALQSLAYRTFLLWEEYSVERVGLGWDKVDLYLLSVEASGFPGAGLSIRPRLDIQLRGEGDFRELRPEVLPPDFPKILIGRTEFTIRPSVAGRWRSGTRFPIDVRWDLGINFIQDYRNAAGDNRTEFVGNVGVLVRTPRWSF